MRTRERITACLLLLAIARSGWAEAVPYVAEIIEPKVQVRSGPSEKAYPTTELAKGDKVKVVRTHDGGWLAIQWPEGSFNWINDRFLQFDKDPKFAYVAGLAGATTRVGSRIEMQMPNKQSEVRLNAGYWVELLDKPMIDENNSKWHPIRPHPQDVRYVPAAAVRPLTGATVAAPPQSGSSPVAPGVPGLTPAVAPTTLAASDLGIQDPQYLQAVREENAGNAAEAIRLYREFGSRTTNPDLKNQCYTRAKFLEAGRVSAPMPVKVDYPPSPAPAALPQPNATAFPNVAPLPPTASRAPTSASNPVPATAYVPPVVPAAPPQRQLGKLVRTGIPYEGRTLYALEERNGNHIIYVDALPTGTVNLRAFTSRYVEVWGGITKFAKQSDLITATSIRIADSR